MKPGKVLLLVMDGLGDRAVKALGYRTPLQCAIHPNLDWFVKNGSSGIMDVVAPGVRPGSDTSHLSLLGYDPYEVYTGRGPFEAAGVGLLGQKGDVAFRCNFATVDKNMVVKDRRAGRIKEPETAELVKGLEGLNIDGAEVIVKEATEHRAVLLLRGQGLSAQVTDADPHDLAKVHEVKPLAPEAKKTAEIVNEFVRQSYKVLSANPINKKREAKGKPPANILLPRGAGVFPDIQPFEKRYGLKGACIAGVSLIKGICKVVGLDLIEVKGATGGLDTDMEAKARAALEALKTYDFLLMNVKATDIASHDGDPNKKVEVIEQLDKMAAILRDVPEEVVIVLAADHCTSVEVGDHTGDPVPLTIYSPSTLKDEVNMFDEVSVARGALGRIRGPSLMPILMDKTNRSEKFGA